MERQADKMISMTEDTSQHFSDICNHCAHFDIGRPLGKPTCKAFTDGIPDKIWTGDNDHKKPYPGDHGIQFEEYKPK